MEAAELATRAWAAGTDFEPPMNMNWMYHLGLSIICILWSFSLLVVCLRVWSRWSAKQLGTDDALMFAAMAVNTGWFYTLVMYMKTCYVGIHYYDVPELNYDQQTTAKLYEWLIILLYHPVLGFVKASVLCFDQKFTGLKKSIRYTVHALQAVNAGCMISIFCVTLFQCQPISLNWTPSYKRTCIDNIAFNYAYNCIVIATDVAVLAVPFWAFIGLQMRTRLKVAILCLFGLGAIVTVVSCIRLVLLVTWFDQYYKGQGSKDIYYSMGWIASPIESNLAIISASIPALWPLFRRAFPNAFSGLGGSSYRAGAYPPGSNRASAFRSNMRRPTRPSRIDDDDVDDGFAMKAMGVNAQVDCRATTPTGSQDGIINYKDGIVRTTNVEIGYESNSKSERESPVGGEEVFRKKMAYAV